MSLLLTAIPWWGRILAVLAALVAAAAFGAAKMHSHDQARYDALQAQFEAFKDKTEAIGIQARKDAQAKEQADKQRKVDADAENTAALAAVAADVGRLRDARPSGSFVPAAPAGSGRPDLLCFDRAEYQRADGAFTAGARGLSDEGTAATVNLNTARKWALALKLSRAIAP